MAVDIYPPGPRAIVTQRQRALDMESGGRYHLRAIHSSSMAEQPAVNR